MLQNNTAKLVKQLSKSAEKEGQWAERRDIRFLGSGACVFDREILSALLDLRNLASELVDGWMAIIRSQSVSNSSPAGTAASPLPSAVARVTSNTWCVCLEKKSKKDESKVSNVKEKNGEDEKKKAKPKAHAPSHAKIRSIGELRRRRGRQQWRPLLTGSCFCAAGLEMDTPSPLPPKKMPAAPQLGDKYNIKPPVLKRPRYVSVLGVKAQRPLPSQCWGFRVT